MPHPYPTLARHVVRQHLVRRELPMAEAAARELGPEAPLWHEAKACFVSIKTATGELRGCMGTFMPTQPALGREIAANALLAAMKDPRFPPVTLNELDSLQFSVDVLTLPEPVADIATLDPQRFGVIVTKDGHRGLLLPALEGVTTVEQQLSIAASKAGMPGWQGADIQRFEVQRYTEKD